MIFKIKDDEIWLLRGWVVSVHKKEGMVSHRLIPWVKPDWYRGKATTVCPSMLEGWSKKLLTARQV